MAVAPSCCDARLARAARALAPAATQSSISKFVSFAWVSRVSPPPSVPPPPPPSPSPTVGLCIRLARGPQCPLTGLLRFVRARRRHSPPTPARYSRVRPAFCLSSDTFETDARIVVLATAVPLLQALGSNWTLDTRSARPSPAIHRHRHRQPPLPTSGTAFDGSPILAFIACRRAKRRTALAGRPHRYVPLLLAACSLL